MPRYFKTVDVCGSSERWKRAMFGFDHFLFFQMNYRIRAGTSGVNNIEYRLGYKIPGNWIFVLCV